MRKYRKEITEMGQQSNIYLNKYVQDVLNILPDFNIIGDIGCGLGFHTDILKKIYPDKKFIGVDFSKPTIDYLKKTNIFDQVFLASSKELPITDKYLDVAISMEALEHLYYEDVMDALYELKRVSKYIIITTPIPQLVINIKWLIHELTEAVNDMDYMSENDYKCLESCVHKSIIFPQSLINAGFKQIKKYNTESECYYVESDKLDLSQIEFLGIKQNDLLNNCLYKNKYIDLLNKSLSLNNDITIYSLQ